MKPRKRLFEVVLSFFNELGRCKRYRRPQTHVRAKAYVANAIACFDGLEVVARCCFRSGQLGRCDWGCLRCVWIDLRCLGGDFLCCFGIGRVGVLEIGRRACEDGVGGPSGQCFMSPLVTLSERLGGERFV